MAYICDGAGGIFCVTGKRRQEENRSVEHDFSLQITTNMLY